MSWLVAVCFPGLLMVGAVGLQRLESVLHTDRPTAAEHVTRLEQLARAARTSTREHTGPLPMKTLPSPILRPQAGPVPRVPLTHRAFAHDADLPTRLRSGTPPNPHFQPAGYANPV